MNFKVLLEASDSMKWHIILVRIYTQEEMERE